MIKILFTQFIVGKMYQKMSKALNTLQPAILDPLDIVCLQAIEMKSIQLLSKASCINLSVKFQIILTFCVSPILLHQGCLGILFSSNIKYEQKSKETQLCFPEYKYNKYMGV